MSDDLTDRLRNRGGPPCHGDLGLAHDLYAAADEIDRLRATIAALLAGTTNCARNLRNLGEAHRDGDDPIIDGIILDSGVIPDAPMSSLFIAAADALDDLAAVVEGPKMPPQLHTRPDLDRCEATDPLHPTSRCIYVTPHSGYHEYDGLAAVVEGEQ